jgi:hypothetical protein
MRACACARTSLSDRGSREAAAIVSSANLSNKVFVTNSFEESALQGWQTTENDGLPHKAGKRRKMIVCPTGPQGLTG